VLKSDSAGEESTVRDCAETKNYEADATIRFKTLEKYI
jgi:hypothetical protein